MKTTKEKIEVMQGFEEGKPIQIRSNKRADSKWSNFTETPHWNWEENDYRIKPEPKPPTYRPYESTDELIADYKARFNVDNPPYTMPFIWVKQSGFLRDLGTVITSFDKERVWLGAFDTPIKFDELFRKYTYLDGSPCGKLVEE